MKFTISKYFLISTLLLVNVSTYALAEAELPTSNQKSDDVADEIEIVPEIKIEAQSSNSPSNPKLKEGDACSDEHLEEIKGETIIVLPPLPMAKTIPCDKVDCSDLKPAKVGEYKIKKLPPTAKTISCQKK